jgi:hypothetical protein
MKLVDQVRISYFSHNPLINIIELYPKGGTSTTTAIGSYAVFLYLLS